jgi:predicted HTH domain antitoxin
MTSITVPIPDVLLLQSGASIEELSREGRFLLALKYFETGRLTSGQAAEMCGMNRVDFLLTVGRQGVPIAELDREELQAELENAGRI